jgi:hypothetical protein
MDYKDIMRFGEIQYLQGRLDELYKALPTITNMDRKRKIDQRIEKYINKFKAVDEVAYHLYSVEMKNRHRSKEKSKTDIKNLLELIVEAHDIDEVVMDKINKQLEKYDGIQ